MLIKVCGMRESENIREAEQLGVDIMGFIFYPPSPRFVARKPGYMPGKVRKAGVFVNEPAGVIARYIEEYGLDYIQLHGHENPQTCREWQQRGIAVIKSIAIAETADLLNAGQYDGICDLLLFDTRTPQYGGSGKSFDWSILSAYKGDTPFLLSGGISETDAGLIKQISHPRFAGVDLNSRFEFSPALKDVSRLSTFINEINLKTHTDNE